MADRDRTGRRRWKTGLLLCVALCAMLLAVYFYVFPQCCGGESGITPAEFVSLRLYLVSGFDFDKVPDEELSETLFVTFDRQSNLDLFRNAYFSCGKPMWKGPDGAVATLKNGDQCRLCVSNMGFFQILNQKGYYFIRPDDWDEYRKLMDDTTRTFNKLTRKYWE